MEDEPNLLAEGEIVPKPAFIRIVDAVGARPTQQEAFWLGIYTERYVRHARK